MAKRCGVGDPAGARYRREEAYLTKYADLLDLIGE
jgi:hypothetical protein